MRIKLDENVTIAAQPVLIKHGHDVHTVHDEDLIGAPDSDLLTVCRDEQRMLVTFDLGFGDLRTYPPGTHPGVIVLRLDVNGTKIPSGMTLVTGPSSSGGLGWASSAVGVTDSSDTGGLAARGPCGNTAVPCGRCGIAGVEGAAVRALQQRGDDPGGLRRTRRRAGVGR